MEGKKQLHLRVITPNSLKVDESADMVIMRCTTGDMGILPEHEQRSVALDYGVLRMFMGKSEKWMAVFGGVAEIKNNAVTILANAAEWPEDIDVAQAKLDQENFERRMRDASDIVEIRKEQAQLRRALVRIEVSTFPLINQGSVEH